MQLVGKADAVAAGVKEVLDLIRQVNSSIIILTTYFLDAEFFYKLF